jgi:hypothetical protein
MDRTCSHFQLHGRPPQHMVVGGEMPLLGCAPGGRAPPVRYLCGIPRRLLIERERRSDRRESTNEGERGQEGYL